MIFKTIAQRLALTLTLMLIASCIQSPVQLNSVESVTNETGDQLNQALIKIVKQHHVRTAGVAVIKNGKVVWQGYYGEQSPGIPASASTLFNVGSITKTITAEIVLRLVAQGKLSLNEPMTKYWLDPDLANDANHFTLTPRMSLSHTSGFLNWRFLSKDNKLKFVNPPGTTFGYSGEGFKYLAMYVENKLDLPFESIVHSTLFGPLGMKDASIKVRRENFDRIAKPFDANGKFFGYYCYPSGYCRKEGSYSAAGDMVITVSDYTKFFISAMRGEGLDEALLKERNTITSVQVERENIDCKRAPQATCPVRLGYGLGWSIAELENDRLIGHRGSDWSVVSLAYYYEKSRDGLVIFINAPNHNGIAAMISSLELMDPDSPELHGYKMRLARFNK
jgi:CubicO group peptidase (beta-lactamase class C family)